MRYFVVEPCKTSPGFEIKIRDRKIDMKKAEKAFSGLGEVVGSTPVVLLVKVADYQVSVYASGRMLVKSPKKLTSAEVERLAEKIVGELEKQGCI